MASTSAPGRRQPRIASSSPRKPPRRAGARGPLTTSTFVTEPSVGSTASRSRHVAEHAGADGDLRHDWRGIRLGAPRCRHRRARRTWDGARPEGRNSAARVGRQVLPVLAAEHRGHDGGAERHAPRHHVRRSAPANGSARRCPATRARTRGRIAPHRGDVGRFPLEGIAIGNGGVRTRTRDHPVPQTAAIGLDTAAGVDRLPARHPRMGLIDTSLRHRADRYRGATA